MKDYAVAERSALIGIIFLLISFIGFANQWDLALVTAPLAIISFVVMISAHFYVKINSRDHDVDGDDVVRLIKGRGINLVGIMIPAGLISYGHADSLVHGIVGFIVAYVFIFYAWGITIYIWTSVRPIVMKDKGNEKESDLAIKDKSTGWIFLMLFSMSTLGGLLSNVSG